jgi:EPS-associated MarR family transcriptional regulator
LTETHLRLLRAIEANPQATQRELAEALGVSLGKAHYCLRALVDKGWVKARNFRASPNKKAYVHALTRKGLEAKAQLTVSFLRRKLEEYHALRAEIEQLQREVEPNKDTEQPCAPTSSANAS